MFGQFAELPEWVPPLDGWDDAPGLAEGDGLAALTIATPPMARRPIERSTDATARRGPVSQELPVGADAAETDASAAAAAGSSGSGGV
jgi:hypothetical protein